MLMLMWAHITWHIPLFLTREAGDRRWVGTNEQNSVSGFSFLIFFFFFFLPKYWNQRECSTCRTISLSILISRRRISPTRLEFLRHEDSSSSPYCFSMRKYVQCTRGSLSIADPAYISVRTYVGETRTEETWSNQHSSVGTSSWERQSHRETHIPGYGNVGMAKRLPIARMFQEKRGEDWFRVCRQPLLQHWYPRFFWHI